MRTSLEGDLRSFLKKSPRILRLSQSLYSKMKNADFYFADSAVFEVFLFAASNDVQEQIKCQGRGGLRQCSCPNIVDSRICGQNEKNDLKNTTENRTQDRLNVHQM